MIQSFHKQRKEFKLTAVRAVKSGKTVAEVAKMCGVSVNSIYAWWKKYKDDPEADVPNASTTVLKPWRVFEEAFRKAVVQEVQKRRKVADVAEEAGISKNAVYEWVDLYAKELKQSGPVVELSDLQAQVSAEHEEREKRRLAKLETDRADAERVVRMMADPLTWLQTGTKTKDSHWQEHGAESPYRPFPDWPYFDVLLDDFERIQPKSAYCVEKSRDMLISWLFVGIFTHKAMTTAGIEVLFQSQKQEKADELIEYAKILYEQSDEAIKKAYPLERGPESNSEIVFANGSRIIAIPGGGDQIRSYHPWGLLIDEAAFVPEAGEAFDNALPVCQKVVAVSSAGPGWFADYVNNCEQPAVNGPIKGLSARKNKQKTLVRRVHYSAHPERGPEWVAQARAGYTSQATWDREQEIIHEAGGGARVFAEVLDRWEDKILIDLKDGFQASPYWKLIGGFDHGKTNPTAALVGRIDQDGVIYITGEYYMPGLSPKEHKPNLRELTGFLEAEEVLADPSIFSASQAQGDGSFKAISQLYIEEGIVNLFPAPERNELTGMARILNHWANLDKREPTLKIVCPRELREIGKPMYGVFNYGCPNLLWELKRTRTEQLSAGQLIHKNQSERIVDKDNHLRDCLKYIVLALLEPTRQTPHQKALEAIKDIPLNDPTSRMIRYQDAKQVAEEKDSAPYVPMGMRGRYILARRDALKNRREQQARARWGLE
jgi:transposase-like protein